LKPAVLQLIDSFNQGGSELQATQLTRLLCESGSFAIHLATLNPEGPLRTSVAGLDLPPIPPFPLTSFYDLNAVRQLRALVAYLRKHKIQVVHTHDFYTNVFGMAASMLARVPVRIASMRETAGMRSESQLKAQRLAYKLASQVVGNSNAVRVRLMEDGVREDKITVLYNGLDLERLSSNKSRQEVLSQFGLEDRQFVTIVANMRHDVKDYPMFLKAAALVREQLPAASFLMAGEGELTDSLRAQAEELGISSQAHFLGRCSEVAELLSISSVCVLSSKAEGFSNSILEYMAAGRPVVATDVGGAREAIVEGETGYLVKSGDAESMAKRIVELLLDQEKNTRFGEAGRRIVESKFSTEAQLRKTEALYQRLLTAETQRR
jgi:glycosyltransferase involved in cell wall biosynthesis